MTQKMTTDEFIRRARLKHGDKYDYSKTDLEHRDEKGRVIITCPKHGDFIQAIGSHLQGAKCKKCFHEQISESQKMTTEQFIEKARKVHGDKYDYSKVKYINSQTHVIITCPKHGDFIQTPNNHLNGQGCQKCYDERRKGPDNKFRKTTEQFIIDAKSVHGNKYDYSKVEYVNTDTKVCVICPKHGEFWARPDHHLNGVGCPSCKESKLEASIKKLLDENGVEYIRQCKKNTLPWLEKQSLDFYLPKLNAAIECQGIQHFEPRKRFGGKMAYEKCNELDKRKFEKCKTNNVKLLYYGEMESNKFENYFTDKIKLLNEIKGSI